MDKWPSQRPPLVGVAKGANAGAEVGKALVVHHDLLDGDRQQVSPLGALHVDGPTNGVALGGVKISGGQVVEARGHICRPYQARAGVLGLHNEALSLSDPKLGRMAVVELVLHGLVSGDALHVLSGDSAASDRIAPAGSRHPPHRTGRAPFKASGSPSDGLDQSREHQPSAIVVGCIHPFSGVVRSVPHPPDCPPSPCGRLSRPQTTTGALPHDRHWPKLAYSVTGEPVVLPKFT